MLKRKGDIKDPKSWSYKVNEIYAKLYDHLNNLISEAKESARELGEQCPVSLLKLLAEISREQGVKPIRVIVTFERDFEPFPEIIFVIVVDPEDEYKEGLLRIYDRIREELGMVKLPFYIKTTTPQTLDWLWDDIIILRELKIR